MNTQSPFNPFRVDLPREEGSWLVDREAIRPKRCKGLGRDGLWLWFRYRRLIGAVIVAAVAGGAAGFGYLWFAMP